MNWIDIAVDEVQSHLQERLEFLSSRRCEDSALRSAHAALRDIWAPYVEACIHRGWARSACPHWSGSGSACEITGMDASTQSVGVLSIKPDEINGWLLVTWKPVAVGEQVCSLQWRVEALKFSTSLLGNWFAYLRKGLVPVVG